MEARSSSGLGSAVGGTRGDSLQPVSAVQEALFTECALPESKLEYRHALPVLRALRTSRNLSLKEVGLEVGLTGEGLGVIERRKSATSPTIQCRIARFYDASIDDLFERPVLPAEGLLSQSQAIARAGVSHGRWAVWRRQGRITPVATTRHASSPMLLFRPTDVDELASWLRRGISEPEAMRRLGVRETGLRTLRESGELGEWRAYGRVREYDREGVERHARTRARLMSMRAYCREYDLPMWVLLRLDAQGLLETLPGPKGAKLVDPLQLKPLIEAKPCQVCGDLAPAGRLFHAACVHRTEEARTRSRLQIIDWWASPAAEAWREKKRALACPNCRETFSRTESKLRSIGNQRPDQTGIFCSQACGAEYRWKKGIRLENFVATLPGPARQRWHGRWNGYKGAADGIEAGRAKGGRPPLATPEQQQEMLRLDREGRPTREIAERVFGDARYKDRVYRFLNR